MEGFRKVDGTQIQDLGKYVRTYLTDNKHKEIKVMIGADANEVGRRGIMYATTVCLYHVGHGAHVVSRREFVKKDLARGKSKARIFEKIWGEVERVFAVCEYLSSHFNGKISIEAHFDINPNETAGSNIVYGAAMGFMTGSGFQVKSKPDAWAASSAAHHAAE